MTDPTLKDRIFEVEDRLNCARAVADAMVGLVDNGVVRACPHASGLAELSHQVSEHVEAAREEWGVIWNLVKDQAA